MDRDAFECVFRLDGAHSGDGLTQGNAKHSLSRTIRNRGFNHLDILESTPNEIRIKGIWLKGNDRLGMLPHQVAIDSPVCPDVDGNRGVVAESVDIRQFPFPGCLFPHYVPTQSFMHWKQMPDGR